MIKSKITKFATLAVGMTFVFGVMATPAGAQTVAELQAQINALMAQLASLSSTSAPAASATFTSNLTLGSKGAEVTSLQQVLVAGGHLVMPTGAAYGYFGTLTKAALAKWQAANGVAPASGYWGPISRAKYASMGGTTTVPGTTVPPAGITTPGVEGTVTVSLGASPASGTKLYEGDDMRKVLGIELEAKTSDIRVERVKLDLDCSTCSPSGDTNFYRKIAQKIYIMDGSTVLGSSDLNSSTVVEDGSDYFITIAGLNFVVPKGTEKVLTVALDAHATWDSTYDNDSWTLGVPVEGIRGVDGAGVNQYGPSTAFTRSFVSTSDLIDDATLALSTNANTPAKQQVVCAEGADEDECDLLEVARFDFKATKDDVTVTDFVTTITRGGASVATATTAYLYDGSTLVGSESVVGTSLTAMTATFDDIDWTVSKDSTKTLVVKLDVDDAALAADTFTVTSSTVTAENSEGDAVTATGSGTGKTITIRNQGPEISLISKSITTNGVAQSSTANSFSTSTLSATFNVKIKAVGGDVVLGTVASATPAFAKTGAVNSFALYKDGVASSVNNATSTSYTIPSTCVTFGTNSCTLSEGSEVTVSVSFVVPGRDAASAAASAGLYSVGFAGLNWNAPTSAVQATTFMAGETDWRTSDVSFP